MSNKELKKHNNTTPSDGEAHEVVTNRSSSVTFSGPLPPPALLAQYDETVPGAADRIISMAEGQSTHRHKIESWSVGGDTVKSILGLFFGFIIALAGIGAGTYLILKDKEVWGIVSILTPLGIIVGGFLVAREGKVKEIATKQTETSKSST